jgi:hypothetical protein
MIYTFKHNKDKQITIDYDRENHQVIFKKVFDTTGTSFTNLEGDTGSKNTLKKIQVTIPDGFTTDSYHGGDGGNYTRTTATYANYTVTSSGAVAADAIGILPSYSTSAKTSGTFTSIVLDTVYIFNGGAGGQGGMGTFTKKRDGKKGLPATVLKAYDGDSPFMVGKGGDGGDGGAFPQPGKKGQSGGLFFYTKSTL